jgi:hypothetical protein
MGTSRDCVPVNSLGEESDSSTTQADIRFANARKNRPASFEMTVLWICGAWKREL